MVSTFSPNLNLELQGQGDNVDTWGDPTLNQNVFTRIDGAMGSVLSVALSSSSVTLTLAQWLSQTIVLTGTLSANVNVSFPLSIGLTTAVGGTRVIYNNCSGGTFTVTVKTIKSGSSGVVVPRGVRSVVYSDTADVNFADDRLGSATIMRIPSSNGDPTGSVAGTVASAVTPGSLILDRTNFDLYACTATGTTSTATWKRLTGVIPPPQGYLTLSSSTTNPILTTDATNQSHVYYSPYVGNFVPINNGTYFTPYAFSQIDLTLTNAQTASNIYDVFAYLDSSGAVTMGTGPAWNSSTAGSGSRGTGSGTTQISRTNGIFVNTVQISALNGAITTVVAAEKATYLGSIFIDTTAGRLTCHKSYGQSRKWGVWNAYNRLPIYLKAGDSSSSWVYTSGTIRASSGDDRNKCTVFMGLAEENVEARFDQAITIGAVVGRSRILIGWNSTTGPSGMWSEGPYQTNVNGMTIGPATYFAPPDLGINAVQSLESANSNSVQFFGTEDRMLLSVTWRG